MSDEDIPAAPASFPSPPRRGKGRPILLTIAFLIVFAAGIAIAVVALPRARALWNGTGEPARVPAVAGTVQPQGVVSPRAADGSAETMLDVRIAELEDRLTRINVEAQAASGNAARAEGLLVAVAARRALDGGTPLGYIEGQLRLRFGQAQPRAVATVINAAREPVTLADLEGELDQIGPHLTGTPPGSSWWTSFKKETREMVIIRKATTPSPLPDRALRRAQRLLQSGRVDAALSEVERLPGHEAADRWMQMARRYKEARRALDLIETAAILEPRQMRAGDGATVTQSSPLAP